MNVSFPDNALELPALIDRSSFSSHLDVRYPFWGTNVRKVSETWEVSFLISSVKGTNSIILG